MVTDPSLVSAEGVRSLFMNGIVIALPKDERWLFLTPKQKEALARLCQSGVDVVERNRRITFNDYMGT